MGVCHPPARNTVGELADRISQRFTGERVQCCISRLPDEVADELAGQRLLRADAVGGHVLVYFDDVTLHSQLAAGSRWLVGPRAFEPECRRRLEMCMESGWLTALDVATLDVVRSDDDHEVTARLLGGLCAPDPSGLGDAIARRHTGARRWFTPHRCR